MAVYAAGPMKALVKNWVREVNTLTFVMSRTPRCSIHMCQGQEVEGMEVFAELVPST